MLSCTLVLRRARPLVFSLAQLSSTPAPVTRWGPDRLLPANSLTTSWPDGRVELRSHPHPSSSYPTTSVWTMLHQTVDRWHSGQGVMTGAQGPGEDRTGSQEGWGLGQVDLCRVP